MRSRKKYRKQRRIKRHAAAVSTWTPKQDLINKIFTKIKDMMKISKIKEIIREELENNSNLSINQFINLAKEKNFDSIELDKFKIFIEEFSSFKGHKQGMPWDKWLIDWDHWTKANIKEEKGSIKLKKDTSDQDIKKYTDKGFNVELNEELGQTIGIHDDIIEIIASNIAYNWNDYQYDDIDSRIFASRIIDDLEEAGYKINKFDSTQVNEEDINSPLMMKLRASKIPKPIPEPKLVFNINKIQDINKKIEILEKERKKIELELENDPEVINNSTDGNHPQIVHYGKLLNKIDTKIFDLIKKKKELSGDVKMTPYINIDEHHKTTPEAQKSWIIKNLKDAGASNEKLEKIKKLSPEKTTELYNKLEKIINGLPLDENIDENEKFHINSRNLKQTSKDLDELIKKYEAGDKTVTKDIKQKYKVKKELEAIKGQLNETNWVNTKVLTPDGYKLIKDINVNVLINKLKELGKKYNVFWYGPYENNIGYYLEIENNGNNEKLFYKELKKWMEDEYVTIDITSKFVGDRYLININYEN